MLCKRILRISFFWPEWGACSNGAKLKIMICNIFIINMMRISENRVCQIETQGSSLVPEESKMPSLIHSLLYMFVIT